MNLRKVSPALNQSCYHVDISSWSENSRMCWEFGLMGSMRVQGAICPCSQQPSTSTGHLSHHPMWEKWMRANSLINHYTHNHRVWEALIKWKHPLQSLDLLGCQFDIEGLDIPVQMFHLSSTYDGEHVLCFLLRRINTSPFLIF